MSKEEIQEIVRQALAAEKRRQFRRKMIWAALIFLFVPVLIYAASVTIPNAFSDGETLSASKLNENFQALATASGDSVPIGTIVAWHKSQAGVPALPTSYAECNGQTLNDANSPLNGQTLPNLNNAQADPAGGATGTYTKGSFLRGHSISGIFESDSIQGHYHTFSTSTTIAAPNNTVPGIGSSGNQGNSVNPTIAVTNPITDGTNGNPRAGKETRPVNMSVVWIIRIK